MWIFGFVMSVMCLGAAFVIPLIINYGKRGNKGKISLFKSMFAGVFVSAFWIFLPVIALRFTSGFSGGLQIFLLSLFTSMQIFTIGTEFSLITEAIVNCPDIFAVIYQVWSAVIFVLAPLFTFGFVLSMFKNMLSNLRYITAFFKDVYAFSELNEKSLALATDIMSRKKNTVCVFADVFEDNEEGVYEQIERAKKLGAICFKKDILVINFGFHSPKKEIYFFTIGENETENQNQALKLIEKYRERRETRLYVFSKKIECELLLSSVKKGNLKVRRVNEVHSLINRILYEKGDIIFKSARPLNDNSIKVISAIVLGMGHHGTEMVKALSWFCQMDGYRININAFDSDDLAEEKFKALAPELMEKKYSEVTEDGEAVYNIQINSGYNVDTATFINKIYDLPETTYVFVALGNDDINIKTAINMRVIFERMGIKPVIQAVVYDSAQKEALDTLKNFEGESYEIGFIGDRKSCYTEDVIIDSDLEEAALKVHFKYDKDEEKFWSYEYNYNSSVASAIHMRARQQCGIPGVCKKKEEHTPEEKDVIGCLEHKRWNAYIRSEGYIFNKNRNNLGKMHNKLVPYEKLEPDIKLIDYEVATE